MTRYCYVRFRNVIAHFFTALFLVLLLFVPLGAAAQPVISLGSPSPAAGTVGSTVTINGSNFSTIPSENIVYFGSVRAVVSTATASALSVTVPPGSSYKPVTVTRNGLTAQSARYFAATFSGGGAINSNSISAGTVFGGLPTGLKTLAADFDIDGYADVAVINAVAPYGISVFRNISSNGNIALAPKIDFPTSATPTGMAVADIDGDGKLDMIVSNGTTNTVSIYLNLSSGSVINFANKVDYATGLNASAVAAGDINRDGKPEIVVSNKSSNTFSVLKNTSNVGVISFDPKADFPVGTGPVDIAIADMSGDNKLDVVILNNGSGTISVYKNAGMNTTDVSLTIETGFPGGGYTGATRIILADVDKTGPPSGYADLCALYADKVVVRRNSSEVNIVLFGQTAILAVNNPYDLSAGDIDGDGKADIVVTDGANSVHVFKNIAADFMGTPDFNAAIVYPAGNTPSGVAVTDLDNDGKVDVIASNTDGIITLRNKTAEPKVVASGTNPVSGPVVNKVTIDPTVQTNNGVTYVQRHYDIQPVNNPETATATVTLYFSQQEFNSFNAFLGHGLDLPTGPADNVNKSNLRVHQYHGFSASGLPGGYSGDSVIIDPSDDNIIWNSVISLWEVTFDVNGFSGFFVSAAGNSLPVTLLSFTGTIKEDKADLNWTTAREINTHHFELQRSVDGYQFNTVATIKASLNTNSDRKYQYADVVGTNTVYYYRLIMVDVDGSTTFSHVVRIRKDNGYSFTVYPNPTHGYFTVEHRAVTNKTQLKLVDVSGRVIKMVDVLKGASRTTFVAEGVIPGVYKIVLIEGANVVSQPVILK